MRLNKVSVNIRYSRQMNDGSFKTVELGCEGSLDSGDEDWRELQAHLYQELGEQMRHFFSGNGSGKAQNGSEKAVEDIPAPPPPLSSTTEGALVRGTRDQFQEVRQGWQDMVLPQSP
jgi:hypothetical protein